MLVFINFPIVDKILFSTGDGVDPTSTCRLSGKGDHMCSTKPFTGSGNYRLGDDGLTKFEFSIPRNEGLDTYDISVVDGFDVPLTVEADDRTLNCQSQNCRDGKSDDDPDNVRFTYVK